MLVDIFDLISKVFQESNQFLAELRRKAGMALVSLLPDIAEHLKLLCSRERTILDDFLRLVSDLIRRERHFIFALLGALPYLGVQAAQ